MIDQVRERVTSFLERVAATREATCDLGLTGLLTDALERAVAWWATQATTPFTIHIERTAPYQLLITADEHPDRHFEIPVISSEYFFLDTELGQRAVMFCDLLDPEDADYEARHAIEAFAHYTSMSPPQPHGSRNMRNRLKVPVDHGSNVLSFR